MPGKLNNEAKKDHFAKVARLIAIGYEASAVALILESWMVFTMTPGQLDLNTPPSQSPNRVEVVIVVAESRQSSLQKILLIQRDETGNFIGLGAGLREITGMSGRFAELMPPKSPTEDVAMIARMILDAMKIVVSVKGTNPMWN